MTELEMVLSSLLAVSVLLNAVSYLRAERAVPPEIAKTIFNIAREQSARTPAQWDDSLVKLLEETYEKMNTTNLEKINKAMAEGLRRGQKNV